ncbi:MAG: hypothetical protein ACTSPB_26270 [Candidatus Thorarchaeota archaeon]
MPEDKEITKLIEEIQESLGEICDELQNAEQELSNDAKTVEDISGFFDGLDSWDEIQDFLDDEDWAPSKLHEQMEQLDYVENMSQEAKYAKDKIENLISLVEDLKESSTRHLFSPLAPQKTLCGNYITEDTKVQNVNDDNITARSAKQHGRNSR